MTYVPSMLILYLYERMLKKDMPCLCVFSFPKLAGHNAYMALPNFEGKFVAACIKLTLCHDNASVI